LILAVPARRASTQWWQGVWRGSARTGAAAAARRFSGSSY
jgi:hypothetical protein